MGYQNGHTLDKYMPDLSIDEQNAWANEFCEGDEKLKELLLFLWKNNINTHACCKGHIEEKGFGGPYICFSCNNLSNDTIIRLCQNICNAGFANRRMQLSFESFSDLSKLDDREKFTGSSDINKRGKTAAFTFSTQIDFSVLQSCFENALNGKSNPSEYDQYIKLIVRLINIDLSKQTFANIFDYIEHLTISFFPENPKASCFEAYPIGMLFCTPDDFSHPVYKALRYHLNSYIYLHNKKIKIVGSSEPHEEFESLNLSEDEIKETHFSLTEENVAKIERELS